KVEEFFISCIPFDLSLKGASLLAFLSKSEMDFFQRMGRKSHKLNLIFKVPSSKKPVSFFALSDIVAFRKPNPDSPYCFVDVTFRETPFILKEILVEFFVEADEGEAFYKDPMDLPLPLDKLGLVFDGPHLSLLKENVAADRLRIISLSKKKLRVFGEYDGPRIEQSEPIELEGQAAEGVCPIKGNCCEFTPLPDVPGFAYIGLDLQFNPFVVSRLRRIQQGAKSRVDPQA
ncbi:MAG: hypothetical protein WCL50_16355, partial [Spirochaetota bacterium]